MFIDGGEGAEELAGDVGEDGGLASGDFLLREEEKETREEGVDLNGVGEVVELGAEGGGEFGCVERSEERRVGKECRSRWSPYH